MLFDPRSFREAGGLVQHRCHDFGMEAQRYFGAPAASLELLFDFFCLLLLPRL